MVGQAKSLARGILKTLGLDPYYAMSKGLLRNVGWLRSYQEKSSIDQHGNPIPWYCYSAITFLERRVNRDMEVFEYGCGNSTRWWASHVARVTACEHDRDWYEQIRARTPENVELHHIDLVPGGAYAQKPKALQRQFDIIIIDGRDRVNCAKHCLEALKEDGVIVWDNCDRDDYQEGFQHLADHGFRKVEFRGLGPIIPEYIETGIFYRSNNVLGI